MGIVKNFEKSGFFRDFFASHVSGVLETNNTQTVQPKLSPDSYHAKKLSHDVLRSRL